MIKGVKPSRGYNKYKLHPLNTSILEPSRVWKSRYPVLTSKLILRLSGESSKYYAPLSLRTSSHSFPDTCEMNKC